MLLWASSVSSLLLPAKGMQCGGQMLTIWMMSRPEPSEQGVQGFHKLYKEAMQDTAERVKRFRLSPPPPLLSLNQPWMGADLVCQMKDQHTEFPQRFWSWWFETSKATLVWTVCFQMVEAQHAHHWLGRSTQIGTSTHNLRTSMMAQEWGAWGWFLSSRY